MDALSIMKTLENSSPIRRSNRVASVWGRCALAALLPLAVLQPALAQSKVSDADLEIATSSSGSRLDPRSFVFANNILVDQAALSRALAGWTGRDLNSAELEKALAAMVQHLRTQGHPNAKVSIASERGALRVQVDGLSPTEQAYAQVQPVAPVVDVRSITVDGATQASAEELQAAVQPWVGKALTVAQLQEPARAVTDLLKAKGLSLAQAFVPAQDLKNGVLRVQVVEGVLDGNTGLAGVVVKGVERTDPAVVARTIAPGAVAGQPLRAAELEKRLMLANELPGLKVKASLVPGSQFGTTAVEVSAQEEQARSVQVYVDNYGNRYTGQTRVGADLDVYSPTGRGDLLSLGGVSSTDSKAYKFAWSAPTELRDARVGASLSGSESNLALQNINVRFDGRASVFSLFAQVPIQREPGSLVNALVSIDNKQLKNEFEGMLFDKRELNNLNLGFNGAFLSADRQAQSRWVATLTTGRVQLKDRLGSLNPRLDTQGQFTKLVADYRVSRPLTGSGEMGQWSMSARASGQLHVSGANLDNAEKFQLGGPDGVRGYPVGEGWGDTGYLASLEFSRPLAVERLHAGKFFLFVDTGSITRNPNAPRAAEASDGIPNTYQLHSAGLGLKLDLTPVSTLQLVLANPWGKNPAAYLSGLNVDGRGQSRSRLWMTLNARF